MIYSSEFLVRSRPPSLAARCENRRPHPRTRRSLLPLTAAAAGSGSAAQRVKEPPQPAVVVGAGIAGLATAVALHRAGVPVRVLEVAPSLRNEGSAIGLWDNAWRALEFLGVADALRPHYLPLDNVEICRGETGRVLRRFPFSDCEGGAGSEFRGVHRAALLRALAAALPPDTITFGCTVEAIEEQTFGGSGAAVKDPVVLRLSGTGTSSLPSSELRCSLLVGADGGRSSVARHLGLPLPNFSGYSAYRGVAVINGEQDANAALGLPPRTIRQIWGAGTRAGLYQLNEREVYWFVCFNAEENLKAETPEQQLASAKAKVKGWGWNLDRAISATPLEQVSRSRCADRWTVAPWGRGQITLAGDAAHPMTPNLGQGGCTALEDAVVLAAEVAPVLRGAAKAGDLENALRRYEKNRSTRCLPLTVRSNLMGQALQLPLPPVCLARDLFVSGPLFSPSHFLDHCKNDGMPQVAATMGG